MGDDNVTTTNPATDRAKDRLDLVKRLFAVAISIGIGNRLVNADWITNGHLPDRAEFEHLATLLLALYATVLSWDGYLSSVQKKPLNGSRFRFTIDVFLVIIYLILIITSDKTWFWLPILCVIFALYVVWDAASVWEYPASFDGDHQAGSSRMLTVLRVYGLAILDRPRIDRGPLISAVWAGYFVALWLAIWKLFPYFSVLWVIFSGAIGLGLYRRDKERIGADGIRGFKMWQRALIILGLVCFVALVGHVKVKL
jgi:hypothetical protein